MAKSRNKYRQKDNSQSAITRKKLMDFFVKTAELQRKLQIIKEMLAEQIDFTPASLFYRFDQNRKGYIDEKDIEDFLNDAKICYKGSQLKTLFGRIDVNQSQTISLLQFQNFILPNQNPKLRYETMRRATIIPHPYQKLSEKIEWIVVKFFTQIISQYTKLMEYNKVLINSFDFNVEKVFQLLSLDKKNVKAEDIQQFLQENETSLSTEEIGCIVKLIDRKGEGQIHLDDFKSYLATLGLKKQHQIFDQLSPIPALKDYHTQDIKNNVKDRDKTLKQRYKDNKSYAKGMDSQGHHLMGYSRIVEEAAKNPIWMRSPGSSEKKRKGGDG